jgi:Holliday junction resolvasome RuvABC endonuclease subunit
MHRFNVVLGLDPGNVKTGIVALKIFEDDFIVNSEILLSGHLDNSEILEILKGYHYNWSFIETIEGRNNRVGKTVFDTLFWIGRFYERIIEEASHTPNTVRRFYPRHIWQYIAGRPNSNDSDIKKGLERLYGDKFTFNNSHERAAMAVLGYGWDNRLEKLGVDISDKMS